MGVCVLAMSSVCVLAMSRSKREAFAHLLKIGKWALRVKYTPQQARLIESAFKNDPAEIISIAARDLANDLMKTPPTQAEQEEK